MSLNIKAIPGTLAPLPTAWLAGLLTFAPILPVVAGTFHVMLYVALADKPRGELFAYTASSVLLIVLVLPLFFGRLATFEKANRGSGSDLEVRAATLKTRVASLPADGTLSDAQKSACVDARAYADAIDLGGGRPALRWALGFGYIDLWRCLHRAEEALMHLDSRPMLVAAARRDKFRISGSALDKGGIPATIDEGLTNLESQDANTQALGRAKLSEVRRAVNEYRDDQWSGLVHTRNLTNAAVVLTGVVAYALLALAILKDVPRGEVATGTGFFFWGVLFGFLNCLYGDRKTERTVEDYGLATSRIFRTLLYSGLAAVGGMVVVAMSKATLNDVGTAASFPAMRDVFTIDSTAFRLVVAAAFGVSPELLLRVVEKEGERYKAAIKSTQSS